ncbi:MAG: DUF86 domain-containing protein [Candidatus Thermoplasmatota archaeon]|nr:DUF86 domain-containing protein [Candidatus Thermoplasmatota archaeon]
MLDSSIEIQSFIKDKTQFEFKKDRQLHLSVVHLLGIIGEAGNQVSEEVKEQNIDIPWKRIIGMRNRLIHGYFDIDLAIVWKTATEDIPSLIEKIKDMISTHL